MCGIFGWIGGQTTTDKFYDLATNLALETQIRGRHATGFACLTQIDGKEGREFFKAPGPAKEFILRDEWTSFQDEPVPPLFIGHTRAATHGKPEQNENNHPFISRDGRLALIHNGVISGHWQVAQKQNVTLESQCDSEVLLRVIETKPSPIEGIEHCMKTVLAYRRDGAVALLDWEDKCVYLFRNDSRPCHVVRIPEMGNGIAFSSTPSIMKAALKKAKLKSTGEFDLSSFKAYRINLADDGSVPDIEHKKIEMPPLPKTSDFFGSRSGFSRASSRTYRRSQSTGVKPVHSGTQTYFGWGDGPLFAPEEVICPCGTASWLFKDETQVCRGCREYKLSPHTPPKAIGNPDVMGRFHCSDCGLTFEQRKEITQGCIKCGSVQITKCEKRKRLKNTKPAIWECTQCGGRMVSKNRPKACFKCKGASFAYQGEVDHIEGQ